MSDSATAIGDVGVRHLGRLPRLGCLELGETRVQGAILAVLAASGTLEILGLRNATVSDDAQPGIATLASLGGLDLNSTRITGRHPDTIAAMPALRELSLHGTPIEPAVVDAPRRSAPHLRVVHSPASARPTPGLRSVMGPAQGGRPTRFRRQVNLSRFFICGGRVLRGGARSDATSTDRLYRRNRRHAADPSRSPSQIPAAARARSAPDCGRRSGGLSRRRRGRGRRLRSHIPSRKEAIS